MTLADDWLSEMYERNYALLYRVGRIFLGAGSAKETLIEDQIQEAFVRAWQKRAALQKHPNPDGWLVDCFRKCLANACRRQNREWRRAAFSVDSQAAPVVKYLKTGTKVTVVDAKGEYCQIHYQGHTYWISRCDLDFAEE